ncbi:MAG: hypothetical protein HC902_05605, partial [Calothrix sp. SM1_5_4]|nr:hypothetical protein [Calothrix sp. SM1_5_4]
MRKASAGVRRRIKEAGELREQLKSSSVQHLRTINNYETKLAEVRGELESLRDKAFDRDNVYNQKLQLENQLVYEQRQFEVSRIDAQKPSTGSTRKIRICAWNSRIFSCFANRNPRSSSACGPNSLICAKNGASSPSRWSPC